MRALVLLFISFTGYISFSQIEGYVSSAAGRGGVATTFVTDYQCIGINPANLGFDTLISKKRISFGLLQI